MDIKAWYHPIRHCPYMLKPKQLISTPLTLQSDVFIIVHTLALQPMHKQNFCAMLASRTPPSAPTSRACAMRHAAPDNFLSGGGPGLICRNWHHAIDECYSSCILFVHRLQSQHMHNDDIALQSQVSILIINGPCLIGWYHVFKSICNLRATPNCRNINQCCRKIVKDC